MTDLFDYRSRAALDSSRPLAERMRPRNLAEFIGQQHLVGEGALIRRAVENDQIFSMILWGPPGCGKTTLARIIAGETRSHFAHFSAVLAGIKDIRAVIDAARQQLSLHRRKTILFVDEIHRFNKAQQDAFLHHVENGLITLIGATTENPSFEVIAPLLSRCRVLTMNTLSEADIGTILARALSDKERGLGKLSVELAPEALLHLSAIADGDGRTALNGLEVVAAFVNATQEHDARAGPRRICLSEVEAALQKKALLYDKSGEEHYNLISALHKSLRGSDPDAALYWLGRMLLAGEDPLYIARRLVRFASEDIGNADPRALGVTIDAVAAVKLIGRPEGDLALAQAAVYLATAPKSNSLYAAYQAVTDDIAATGSQPVPFQIRNAPTRLMKDLGYGKGYRYAHDYAEAYAPQEYLPNALKGRQYYRPTDRGYEKIIKERLDHWQRLKKTEKS
ncbi:MAG: replication-associated recombination protein A [Deltaproteobacteria bacterium]|nr:replication-associated recombination protein A [Deltaproteobacteria bacterium]